MVSFYTFIAILFKQLGMFGTRTSLSLKTQPHKQNRHSKEGTSQRRLRKIEIFVRLICRIKCINDVASYPVIECKVKGKLTGKQSMRRRWLKADNKVRTTGDLSEVQLLHRTLDQEIQHTPYLLSFDLKQNARNCCRFIRFCGEPSTYLLSTLVALESVICNMENFNCCSQQLIYMVVL